MKSRLKLIIGMIVLVLLSFIAGFTTILNEKYYTPGSEYLFVAISGTLSVILILGTISLIVYKLLKRNGNLLAAKRALQCYQVFVLLMALTGVFKFKATLQKRDRIEFVEQFNKQLKAFVYAKIDNSLYHGIDEDSLAENADKYISCIKAGLENDTELLDHLMESKDKVKTLQHDARFMEIEEYCIGYVQRNPGEYSDLPE